MPRQGPKQGKHEAKKARKSDVSFNDFIVAAMDCRLKVGSAEQKYAKELLDAAKSNVRSCRILHDQQQYAESIFLLEQAAEKTDKSLLLAAGLFNINDLMKVGHDAFKASNLALERGAPLGDFMSSLDPRSDDPDSVRIRGRTPAEIARASESSIMATVTEGEEYAREYFVSIHDWLKKQKGTIQVGEGVRKRIESLDLFTEAIIWYSVCVTITHYTSVHAVSARYPGKLGPKDYTTSLGIVAATPRLSVIVERAIAGLEESMPRFFTSD